MLPADVVNIVLRKLPVELRVALGVRPGKVRSTADVMNRVAARAGLEAHPYKLHLAKVRYRCTIVDAAVFLRAAYINVDHEFALGRHFVALYRDDDAWHELELYDFFDGDFPDWEEGIKCVRQWQTPEDPERCEHTCWRAHRLKRADPHVLDALRTALAAGAPYGSTLPASRLELNLDECIPRSHLRYCT